MSTVRNRKSKQYYGVAGVNAYGVYTNYGKVLEAKEYIKQFNCKKHPNFNSAKEWAVERFEDLQGEDWMDYKIQEIKKRNRCYFRQPIVRLK